MKELVDIAEASRTALGIGPLKRALNDSQSKETAGFADEPLYGLDELLIGGERLSRALLNNQEGIVRHRVAEPVSRPAHWTCRVVGAYVLGFIHARLLLDRVRRL